MSFNVIIGPAALSYPGAKGHRYWIGYASGHQSTGIPRRSADIALQDAEKLERKNNDQIRNVKNRDRFISGNPQS